jgi:hypothetical protein
VLAVLSANFSGLVDDAVPVTGMEYNLDRDDRGPFQGTVLAFALRC